MHVRRVVWIGVSALAVASWFAAASTSGVRPPSAPLAPPRPTAVDRSMTALQSEVGRLHDRLAPTVVPVRSRDLFRFSVRDVQRRTRSIEPLPAADREAAPLVPAKPALTLIGIAEDVAADGPVRTAIVSAPGDLFLGKSGDVIGGHYRVDAVDEAAVRLTDTATAVTTTLALR